MWKRHWWRSSRRGSTFGYSGTVKMALDALVVAALEIALLRILGLT
jgi:hypothetical protein